MWLVIRALLAVTGLAVWGVGLWLFIGGSYVGGGLLILTGGACIAVAAQRGAGDVAEGVTNFLYFWR